jgi:hypothetical protein
MAKTKTFILWSNEGFSITNEDTGEPKEYRSEAAALKAAKARVKDSGDEEIWVYHLTHVVSRPDAEPDVEKMP